MVVINPNVDACWPIGGQVGTVKQTIGTVGFLQTQKYRTAISPGTVGAGVVLRPQAAISIGRMHVLAVMANQQR